MLIRVNRLISTKVSHARDVHWILRDLLDKKHQFDREKEHFYVLLISRANRIRYIDEVSIGNLHSTVVSAREVFRFAILKGAFAIIIAHNHPSGNLQPSEEDKNITEKLRQAGEIIGIKVLDSIIISEQGYYSFDEEGLL